MHDLTGGPINDLLEELRDNVELLRNATLPTANERAVLHYSRMLLRVAAGETFSHVAHAMGPARQRKE